MPGIRIERVTKVYGDDVVAVDDVSLEVADGEFMVLVGPSGCGKSTLLRVIAGLEKVTLGRVWIGDDDVTTLEPPDRDMAMVFQSYALYPHKTVRENLAFGLRRRKVPKEEIAERVDRMAAMLGLGELMGRKPAALSGGQRQRVAMGRALVREPRAFLMDEPLSNLDAKLRTSMRGELARLHERLPTTTVYVTHDQVEAMTLGQRVAVLRDGVIQQCDVPQRLFDQPANLFVGAFIGSPAMNLVEARLDGDVVSFGSTELPLAGARAAGERAVILGLRPTELAVAGPGAIRAGRACGSTSTWSRSSARSATCCSPSTRRGSPPTTSRQRSAARAAPTRAGCWPTIGAPGSRPGSRAARPLARGRRWSSRSIPRSCTSSIARAVARSRSNSGRRRRHEGKALAARGRGHRGLRPAADRSARRTGAARRGRDRCGPAAGERGLRLSDRRRLPAARGRLGRLPRLVRGDPADEPAYSICYVNAFQTQADERGVDRPDERSNWPRQLVLDELGDDPNWGGEYLVDVSSAKKRRRAARWVEQMIDGCDRKGFAAVEYDNLDSWTRFDGTPLADEVPFEKREALAYARRLARRAHALGLAVGQKNTADITPGQAREVGFDFAIAEECARYDECDRYRRIYGNGVIEIEYRRKDFRKACDTDGDEISVVLRDRQVSTPGSRRYVYDAC